MAMRRIGVTCCALVALLASATAASSASAARLTLSEGGTALEAGDAFWLYGFNNLFATAAGVECESSLGEVLANRKGGRN
jgi:hypothetical protein